MQVVTHKRATSEDVARLAGVSVSTVDRVLNGRGSVSERARLKVVEAARLLCLRRVLPRIRRGAVHFDVALSQAHTPYVSRLEEELRAACKSFDFPIELSIHRFGPREDTALAGFLTRSKPKRHGLLIKARDTAVVRTAVQRAAQAGVPVVTLTSDLTDSGRAGYVGVDQRQVGRTIGALMGRSIHRPGKVWVGVCSMDLHAHRERYEGFHAGIREHAPKLELLWPMQTQDDVGIAEASLRSELARGYDIVGLYDSGAVTAGLLAALRAHPTATAPVWATHELTALHADLLQSGEMTFIADQNGQEQAFSAIRRLLEECGELPHETQSATRFHIFTKENAGVASW